MEFYGRHVLQARMRTDLVVVAAPSLDHDTGLVPGSKPLLVQALIARPPVEALVGAVLPRLAWIVQCCLDVRFLDSFEDRVADKLWSVVRSHVARRPACTDQTREHFDDSIRSDAASDIDS
jgi:hypothetical protein